jgi:uncharacterized protein
MKNWNVLFENIQNTFASKQPQFLTYHNWEHTCYVITKTEMIAHTEKITEKENTLLKTAALFHDIGYLNLVNMGHEEESITIAKQILPHFLYDLKEIDLVCDLIAATKISHRPKNILEKIIADADLEYLGTTNFNPFGDLLFLELQYFHPDLNRTKWNNIQIDFLEKHQYYTSYCIKNREKTKQNHLQQLKNTITS